MIQQIAQQVSEIQRAYEQGTISTEEYKELIGSMNLIEMISDQTAGLEENITYRNIIVNAIAVAKALA